jgi:hypothetical protein
MPQIFILKYMRIFEKLLSSEIRRQLFGFTCMYPFLLYLFTCKYRFGRIIVYNWGFCYCSVYNWGILFYMYFPLCNLEADWREIKLA